MSTSTENLSKCWRIWTSLERLKVFLLFNSIDSVSNFLRYSIFQFKYLKNDLILEKNFAALVMDGGEGGGGMNSIGWESFSDHGPGIGNKKKGGWKLWWIQ